jgi:hypothetical protein
MESVRNLTRFTYETTAFEGWRLNLTRAGSTFTKYFPDKRHGGPRKSFDIAKTKLAELKALLEGAKKTDGKFNATTLKKAEKLLQA